MLPGMFFFVLCLPQFISKFGVRYSLFDIKVKNEITIEY